MAVAQEEPALVAERAEGSVEVTDEKRFEIRGVRGTLVVRVGPPGELRFMCRSLEKRDEPRTIGIFGAPGAIVMRPTEKTGSAPVRLEIALPPRLATYIETDDSRIGAASLGSALEVVGSQLAVESRSVRGDVKLEIQGGSADVEASGANVTIEGRDVKVLVRETAGMLTARLAGGDLRVFAARGGLALDSEGTTVLVDGVHQAADFSASGGTLEVAGLQAGGTFEVDRAPLTVTGSRMAIEIETDSAATVSTVEGNVRIRGDAGPFRVETISGGVDLDLQRTQVALQTIGGPSKIHGAELEIQAKDVKGDLTIVTASSTVDVAGITGNLTVENQWGDVLVADAGKNVTVQSSEGAVRVANLAGAARVRANGEEVTVHWVTTMPGDPASHVENEGGDVRVMFSPDAGGQLDAQSRDGEVLCTVPDIAVPDDRATASGVVHRRAKPEIRVVAAGNLYVDESTATPPRRRPGG